MGEYLDDLHKEHKARKLRLQRAAFRAVTEPPKASTEPSLPEEPPPPEKPKLVLFSTFDLIINDLCAYYNIRKLDVLSNRRIYDITKQRHMLAYMLYRMTTFTNPQIAAKMGRDPTTISYAINKIRDNLADHATEVEELELRIGDLLTKHRNMRGKS